MPLSLKNLLLRMPFYKGIGPIVVCTKCHSLQKQSDMPSIAAGTFHISSDKIMEKFLLNFQIYSFVIVNVNLEKRNCYTLCCSPPTVVVHSETLSHGMLFTFCLESCLEFCMESRMESCMESCMESFMESCMESCMKS